MRYLSLLVFFMALSLSKKLSDLISKVSVIIALCKASGTTKAYGREKK